MLSSGLHMCVCTHTHTHEFSLHSVPLAIKPGIYYIQEENIRSFIKRWNKWWRCLNQSSPTVSSPTYTVFFRCVLSSITLSLIILLSIYSNNIKKTTETFSCILRLIVSNQRKKHFIMIQRNYLLRGMITICFKCILIHERKICSKVLTEHRRVSHLRHTIPI